MGLALVGENGGTPCGETPCGGTPSVSAGGAASSLREGALDFCLADSPARAAPAKREAFRFDALQTPAQTNCARGSHSGSADHSGAPSSEQTALQESRPSGRLPSVPFVPPLPTATASLGCGGGPVFPPYFFFSLPPGAAHSLIFFMEEKERMGAQMHQPSSWLNPSLRSYKL